LTHGDHRRTQDGRRQNRLPGESPHQGQQAGNGNLRAPDGRPALAKETETDIRRGQHFPTDRASKKTLADLLDKYEAAVLPNKAPGTSAPKSPS